MAPPVRIDELCRLPLCSEPRRYSEKRGGTIVDDQEPRHAKPSKAIARAAHLRGTVASSTCTHCQSNKVKEFHDCVVLLGYMRDRCSNCHYQGGRECDAAMVQAQERGQGTNAVDNSPPGALSEDADAPLPRGTIPNSITSSIPVSVLSSPFRGSASSPSSREPASTPCTPFSESDPFLDDSLPHDPGRKSPYVLTLPRRAKVKNAQHRPRRSPTRRSAHTFLRAPPSPDVWASPDVDISHRRWMASVGFLSGRDPVSFPSRPQTPEQISLEDAARWRAPWTPMGGENTKLWVLGKCDTEGWTWEGADGLLSLDNPSVTTGNRAERKSVRVKFLEGNLLEVEGQQEELEWDRVGIARKRGMFDEKLEAIEEIRLRLLEDREFLTLEMDSIENQRVQLTEEHEELVRAIELERCKKKRRAR